MSTIKLSNGQDIVLLAHNSIDYIYPANVTVGSSFVLNGTTITPIVEESESDGEQYVSINPAVFVTDNFGTRYVKILGPRPKSRVRS